MRPPLRKSQIRGKAFAAAHPYCILALDPRLGKSRAAIEAHEESKRKTCLVICPTYLITHWEFEIHKWAFKKRTVTSIRKGKEIYDLFDSDYAVISYDLALKAPYLFEWAKTIIIDEPHLYLKTMDTKRTEFIHKSVYENSVPSVIQLTGTPIKNRVSEFYCPVALCYYNPQFPKTGQDFLDRFPTAIDFADHFSNKHKYQIEVNTKKGFKLVTIIKWTGMKNIPELKSYLKNVYLRIRADDNELPPIVFVDFYADQSPNEDLMRAFKRFFEAEGKDSVKSDVKAEAALQKIPVTIEYANDLMQQLETPVLIYRDHVEPIERIAKHFGVPAITGEMNAERRIRLAKEFQAGKEKVLCATIGSLQVGVDLSRAKDLILNDLPWVPGDLTQVYNRMRKVGDTETRFIHRILGSPQDEKISNALEEKRKVIERVT